ncbi:oligosaccharide flippase family protein [Clostridium sp. M62/1]|uniref:oligosaccharide flippase family protein n=1 Tax=Clostridium sp. M62/1 TaxID=411486 RepID=UPI003566948A
MGYLKDFLKKIWTKGLLHILAGTFMTKLVGFFGSIFLVRVLSKWEYGILGYLENIYGYIFIFAGLGMSNAILRYVVLGKTQEEKYSYYSYAVSRGRTYNILLIAAALLVAWLYPHPEAYREWTWLLAVLGLAIPFQYTADNVLCNERAMFANQRYAAMSLLLSFSIIVTKIISGKAAGITGVIFCQTGLYIVIAGAYYLNSRRRYYAGCRKIQLTGEKRREVNLYAFQYMITNGLWAIFMLNDTFLLGRFGGSPEMLADYKVAYTIPGSISLISTAIGIFVAPYFVKNEKDKSWIRKNFARTYLISAGFVGSLCLFIAVCSKPLIRLLYGEQYLNISGIMMILLTAAFFNCGLRYTTANILAAMGKVKYNMAVSAAGMAIQIAVNIKMVPVYGTLAVAVTSCIVYAFMAFALLLVFIQQYYKN